MSRQQNTSAERMAHYREERRKHLPSQCIPLTESPLPTRKRVIHKEILSASEEPRTTRTSRLRATANAQETSTLSLPKYDKEKSPLHLSNEDDAQRLNRKSDRDKIHIRKSNLNRTVNPEEVVQSNLSDDFVSRRRRRRFFPPEILLQASNNFGSHNESDKSLTAPLISQAPTSRTPIRKSELRTPVDNARKIVSHLYTGKSTTVSPKNSNDSVKFISTELEYNDPSSSTINRKSRFISRQEKNKSPVLEKGQLTMKQRRSSNVSKRMDELTALTKDALARVERLAIQNLDTNKNDDTKKLPLKTKTKVLQEKSNINEIEISKIQKNSILKKKVDECTATGFVIPSSPNQSAPISILKRKVSLDGFRTRSGSPPMNTPPVTFSPSVIDPSTNRKRQGILKKRRSLDESQVLRHRSCSSEVAVDGRTDSRSILKNQRRSSLEEILRNRSPESGLHGILKRRTFRHDYDIDPPINSPEPHSILKRRSGSSSTGSITHSPHVSIATAVILAAAGGAEMVLEPNELVKPILKKKSFSEDSTIDNSVVEVPKPILKKKSSTDTDECEDKPKKPILKNTKNSFEDRDSDVSEGSLYSSYRYNYSKVDDSSECEVKPILKQNASRDNSPRPRLSFSSNDMELPSSHSSINHRRSSRRSHTICTDFNVKNPILLYKSEDRELQKPRPLSVRDMVLNIEKRLSTGAIPKTTKRHSARRRTQPITYNELEASLSRVQKNQDLFTTNFTIPTSCLSTIDSNGQNAQSLSDLTSSFEGNNITNFLSSSLPNTTFDSGISGKMSSDSAFQSLGDGLELENENLSSPSRLHVVPEKHSPSKLKMKMLAEEAKKMQLKRVADTVSACKQKIRDYPSVGRFSTHPVTVDEIQEASRLNAKDGEASDDFSRGESETERKSILKPKLDLVRINSSASHKCQDSLKPVLKKHDEQKIYGSSPSTLRSILKPETSEFTLDEGISSDDSQSESEVESVLKNNTNKSSGSELKQSRDIDKSSSDDVNLTSDGDSSGGREVRSIIEESKWPTRKRFPDRVSNEGVLKSKSQGVVQDEGEIKSTGVRHSLTQSAMPQKIAELQAKLQQSGNSEWRKRIPKLNNANEELSLLNVKNIYNQELSETTSILAARKDELDAASRQWRSRVEQSDAMNFSVAGRMQQKNDLPIVPINIPINNIFVNMPITRIFKGKEDGDISSLPGSPEKNVLVEVGVKRSISLPGAGDTNAGLQESELKLSRKVKVERPDNITFTSFFKSIESKTTSNAPGISVDDFDLITRGSEHLLTQKQRVRAQRKWKATKNPIKALAVRSNVTDEYTEVIIGVVEKERRLNVEKLAKSSNFAVEALAGLASKEDFSSVALKRSTSWNLTYPPYKDLMLLQVKGRRFVQTRLVEPVASSINDGDCYILITPNAVYNYIGAYSNVIEQSRAVEIANIIQQKSDLGCKCDKTITINSKKIGSCEITDLDKFWKLLSASRDFEVVPAGHPDEDEIYESTISRTNMIYEYKNDELVPLVEYWGATPKLRMLNLLKIFVFDFGSEMYVWSGKNAPLEEKKRALKLSQELWNEGYNYTECGINPLGISMVLGSRQEQHGHLKDNNRPKWALFGKITQHRETILFKEKFLDWPDYSRVICVKQQNIDLNVETKFDFKPCNIEEMCNNNNLQPDLLIDGLHLGRGISHFDKETKRIVHFTTCSITCWVILEYSHEQLVDVSVGQFYDGNSYIVRWEYCANIGGRELSGNPSKYTQSGRDMCLYFCWQGSNATVNEKGAAALLTIQLDSENARQIRVLQGSEPPVFLNLFKGDMVIHCGKHEKPIEERYRLYICRGEIESEAFLTEVPCSMRSLRSRSSFILISCKMGVVTVWNGCKASSQTIKVTQEVATRIVKNQLHEFGFCEDCEEFCMDIIEEGLESADFLEALGGDKRQLYMSLLNTNEVFDFTPKLYNLSSLFGKFESKEILCSYRSQHITPYPYLQSDLYSSSQPALFLLDNINEIWLWQGWWPETENDNVPGEQIGSGAVRWQEERKVAMQTAVAYSKRNLEYRQIPAYLVWAGLEPLAFTNLFPFWRDVDGVTEINMRDGKKPGEILIVEKELELLSRSIYPLYQLLQRPLPDGVDPTHLENYLSPADFSELMSMTLEEFQKLPSWKQTSVKKEKGLF
ncbi:hypothetical protein FQA39_LY13333 [Lamprigera yunnana]|nr:hypothetical protein FQA39_LY13333 [Lamprigera yunnana]